MNYPHINRDVYETAFDELWSRDFSACRLLAARALFCAYQALQPYDPPYNLRERIEAYNQAVRRGIVFG